MSTLITRGAIVTANGADKMDLVDAVQLTVSLSGQEYTVSSTKFGLAITRNYERGGPFGKVVFAELWQSVVERLIDAGEEEDSAEEADGLGGSDGGGGECYRCGEFYEAQDASIDNPGLCSYCAHVTR